MREVTSIKTATLLNAAAKYTNVIFNLLATSILARILSGIIDKTKTMHKIVTIMV